VLDEDGLSAALRVYLDFMREHTDIAVSLVDHLTIQPEAADRVILYRIAQEALANVRKHSRASHAVATLNPQDGGVLVRIEDDGVGFDQASRGSSDALHVGLAAMRERAELAGGWMQIESSPGVGTRLEFYVPGGGTSVEPAKA
jgi:signal transduction histidine kinase